MKKLIPYLGTLLIIIGITLLVIKGFSTEYIDETGLLHEKFYLIPIGFMFIFAGILTFITMGIQKVLKK